MAADDETTLQPPRAGTYADLARRMDRMEIKHEDLAKDVAVITATVGQVVLNQKHAEDINELRFKSLDTAVGQIGSDLKTFITRIEGMIDGTVETNQARQAAQVMADYMKWRGETDKRLNLIEEVPTLVQKVEALEEREQRRKGVLEAFSGVKGIILMLCAIASPLIAAIAIIVTRP